MKLRKLIMCGFKSFADRTEFEFHDGVSCIVGPNGCGKSNVVDGMKWVLGEQSAKSLRGTEMMDVIFNGSSARRAAGMAEVSLVFENSDGMLQPPGTLEGKIEETVSVTRRLYRSGQSEYLINKSPARLKDIREMFMDTGVGRDAYSVIEQGRVEAFLQANQEDRRAIFDEAAGISKYKARKKEASRKLERVEQDLLRVNDVLAEVEKRLRSIKYQAGKARNYQTYAERLKELRLLYFLAQYHTLSQQRRELQSQLDVGQDALSSIHAQIDQLEATHSGTEVEAVDLERSSRELQAQIASLSAQITATQERAEMLSQKVEELGEQIVTIAARNEEMEAKLVTYREEIAKRQGEFEEIQNQATQLAEQYEVAREEQTQGEMAVTHLRANLEDEKAQMIDLMRQASNHRNEIQGSCIRQENLQGQRQRLLQRSEEIAQSLEGLLPQQAELQTLAEELQSTLSQSQEELQQTVDTTQQLADNEQSLRAQLAQAREERSGVQSRIHALEEMESRREGVAAGVRKVLEACKKGRLTAIRGMLGEFLQTDVEHAPIVEAALAGADQRLVAESLSQLQQENDTLNEVLGKNGTVEVICLDRATRFAADFNPSQHPDVIGRVIDWVRVEPSLAPVMWQLLGSTLVVENLDVATRIAPTLPVGTRFVTMEGQVLEADGRLRVGAANQGAGVITRRSELAELQTRQQQLAEQIEHLEGQCQTTRQEIQQLEQRQKELRGVIYEANTQKVSTESRLRQVQEQIETFQREQPMVSEDLAQVAEEIEAVVAKEQEARQKLEEIERVNQEREENVQKLQEEISAAQSRQEELNERLTEIKVAMASAEQRRVALRDSVNSLQRQCEQMVEDLKSGQNEIELNRQRRQDAEGAIAKAREEVETLYERQQKLNTESEDVEETRTGLQERLNAIRSQLAEHRKRQEEAGEQINNRKVKLGQVDTNVENLITRARDEMDMDVIASFQEYEHDAERDWDAVKAEISDLQQKIKRLGNVNLDAIAEQEELEQRETFLSEQLKDISDSRNQLTELIDRINTESQTLFMETFECVRGHFQDLFRKLFGGGRADIHLLDNEDVLESGIEIVARPPGKELRSLMLMSGGEKTMTALALLFSIFKAKPSPFCLLDEVDAALDEANTERFGNLFADFIGTSQFIVISHAKRTMSMANVLYGVTMQEPGVSRRISVKFEDTGKKLDAQLEPVGA